MFTDKVARHGYDVQGQGDKEELTLQWGTEHLFDRYSYIPGFKIETGYTGGKAEGPSESVMLVKHYGRLGHVGSTIGLGEAERDLKTPRKRRRAKAYHQLVWQNTIAPQRGSHASVSVSRAIASRCLRRGSWRGSGITLSTARKSAVYRLYGWWDGWWKAIALQRRSPISKMSRPIYTPFTYHRRVGR
jgi:hypothetical protein